MGCVRRARRAREQRGHPAGVPRDEALPRRGRAPGARELPVAGRDDAGRAPTHVGARSGTIVNVGSVGGRLGIGRETAYSGAKFALTGWTEALALDLWDTPDHGEAGDARCGRHRDLDASRRRAHRLRRRQGVARRGRRRDRPVPRRRPLRDLPAGEPADGRDHPRQGQRRRRLPARHRRVGGVAESGSGRPTFDVGVGAGPGWPRQGSRLGCGRCGGSSGSERRSRAGGLRSLQRRRHGQARLVVHGRLRAQRARQQPALGRVQGHPGGDGLLRQAVRAHQRHHVGRPEERDRAGRQQGGRGAQQQGRARRQEAGRRHDAQLHGQGRQDRPHRRGPGNQAAEDDFWGKA